MQQAFDRHIFRILLGITVTTIVIGTVFYHEIEKFSWLDSYYFSVVTLATVGYGDFVPKTDVGKIFTTFYILVGVGILTTFISYNFRRMVNKREQKVKRKNETT